ncbi:MAG: hypothetical protein K2Q22_17580, partial [Cytophagales bacterium]|nr:hypothetical protein [Cytophagales bacterium]
PSQKLDVFGNIQITGAGNKLMFPDGTSLSSAPTNGWQLKGDTAYYPSSAKILGKLKIGNNSLYLSSQANTGTITNEIYTDNGPLILNYTNAQKVLIGTSDASNLAGLNSYSQNSKVVSNGHISLLGWDNVANTTIDNWFRTDKMVMQNIQDRDANHWNRGLISNNLIWDSGINTYSVLNNTNGQNDFAAIRFDNFGSIGIYTAPQNGNYQSISPAQLDNYKRITISNTGKVGIGNTNPFTDLEVSKSVDPSFRVSSPVNGGIASGGISVASSNGSYNSISTPGDVVFGAGCGGTEDLIIGVADSRNGAIRFTTNGGYGCGVAPDLERLTILGNGNVGIGINNPANKLQVKGSTLLDGDLKVTGAFNFNDNSSFTFANSYLTYSGGFNVQNTLKVGTGSLYLNGAQSNPVTGTASRNEIYTGSGDLYIQDQSSSGNTLLNNSSGKVGIGTNSPANNFRLHIKGTGQTDAAIFLEPNDWKGGATGQINFGDNSHYILAGYSSGMQFFDYNYFNFGTSASPNALRIDQSGKIGIGTNSPNAILDVQGNVGFGQAQLSVTNTSSIRHLFLYADDANQIIGFNSYPYFNGSS